MIFLRIITGAIWVLAGMHSYVNRKTICFLIPNNSDQFLRHLQTEYNSLSKVFRLLKEEDLFDIYRLDSSLEKSKLLELRLRGVDFVHFGGHFENGLPVMGLKSKVTQDEFARFLARELRSKFVFLNSCSSKGMGGLLIRHGVQAVIATETPVEDAIAAQFAIAFYKRIAGGDPIDVAFRVASDWIRNDYGPSTLQSQRHLQTETREDHFGWFHPQAPFPWKLMVNRRKLSNRLSLKKLRKELRLTKRMSGLLMFLNIVLLLFVIFKGIDFEKFRQDDLSNAEIEELLDIYFEANDNQDDSNRKSSCPLFDGGWYGKIPEHIWQELMPPTAAQPSEPRSPASDR